MSGSRKSLAEAYQRLDAVLREVIALEENSGKRGNQGGSYMLTDYLVIAATQGIDGDGDASTGISFVLPHDQEMPLYRMIGLIEFSRTRIKAMVAPDLRG